MSILQFMLILAGIVTFVLGVTHFYYPALFGYRFIFEAYPHKDRELKPFRLWFLRYPMNVDKAHGIIWMMNHHVSLVLVSIGVLEMGWSAWVLNEGRLLALWVALWWLLRTACQPILLGISWYDWLITAGFATLCAGHVWIALS